MSKFKFVELFAGIGGFRQGLTPLGGECKLASEWDPFAQKSYSILYGYEDLYGDVTQINENDVPDHDILVFGMPCQAFSVAGKRLGFEDMRGTLYFEAMRIARAKKPKVLWMENVKGLVGHDNGRTLDVMAQAMSDIGYTIDFEVLNSKYFGVPQNRERIFMIGVRNDLVEPAEWNVGKRSDVVAKGKRRIAQLDVRTFNFDWPAQESVTVRLRDILESDVDEKYYLSEEKTAKLVAQLEVGVAIVGGTNKRSYKGNGELAPTLISRMGTGGGNVPMINEPQMLGHIDLKGHDAIKRVYSAEGVSPTLTTMGGGHREPKIAVKSIGNTHPSGNGINGQVYDIDAGLAPILTTNKGEGPKVGGIEPCYICNCEGKFMVYEGSSGEQLLRPFEDTCVDCNGTGCESSRYRIRKLTPRECFRLQGFADSEFDKLTANGISNSQLYKQAGNAVTVNVISAIGKRLLPLIDQETVR